MPRAWISLGANLGRPQATLTAAAKALEQSEGIAHLRLSSFYSTSPVDSSGPDYVNAAAAVDTNCSPEALLKLLQRIRSTAACLQQKPTTEQNIWRSSCL